MIMQTVRDGVVVATPRNCPRCGLEFLTAGTERICHPCHAPKTSEPRPAIHTLSFREKQVVALVCQAKVNKEIAWELHLTEGTIKEYLHHIFRKTGVESRTGLAIWSLTGHVAGDGAAAAPVDVPAQAPPAALAIPGDGLAGQKAEA
jgi:DNA-binding CsgD family transcriptional regulator